MTYPQFLALHKLPHSASSALAWLKSGQAPMGTPVPAALQPAMHGATTVLAPTGTYTLPLQPGQVARPFDPLAGAPPSPPAPPAPTLPEPQNPYAPQLAMLLQQFQNLPTTYDAQRKAVASQAAASLQGSGLVDFAPAMGTPRVDMSTGTPQLAYDYTQESAAAPGGAGHNYGIVQGADGRAYLQAYADVAHSGASRGVFSGSQVDAQQGQARQALDTQRAGAYQTFQGQHQAVNDKQLAATGDIAKQWADYQSAATTEVPKTVAGWSVTPSAPSGPSPLTQMTGGQNTVTGGTGGTGVKPQTKSAASAWKAPAAAGRSITGNTARAFAGAKKLAKAKTSSTRLKV